jgi:hypothetical protein
VKGNYERTEQRNVLRYRATPTAELPHFLHDAPEVSDRNRWISVSDRIDPQHAVFLGEPRDDLFLAQGIAVPIIAETDDVVSF